DQNEMARHIKSVLEEINPSLVITHYPNHGVHPDHNALGAATIEAVRLMDPVKRPTVWAAAITRNFQDVLGKPDIIHDVSDVFDEKLEAIKKHKSQAEGMIRKIQEEDPENLSEHARSFKERMSTEMFYIWNFDVS